ncbi:LCP family protein [Candidatus Berkelbacteria bacterium]|nr:LCP family protein [Candidatus Berkelbacteria bacterium]
MTDQGLGDQPFSDKRLDTLVRPKRFSFKKFAIIVIAVLAFTAVVYGASTLGTLSKIIVKNTGRGAPQLRGGGIQGEGDGRINVLILGMGGPGHPGGLLADTIMVLSVDPVNHKAAFLTVPRDLAVDYPKPLTGGGKINNVHAFGEERKKEVAGGGPTLMKKAVSEVLDLPIHYFVRVDFKAFEKLVDTVGGVTINVEKPLYDPLYPAPNMIDYEPFSIAAGVQNLNGKTALKYARSRESTSDFDRSRRQIQLLLALKEKVLSLNILGNPRKVNEIATTLGGHLRTDLSIKEFERFFEIATQIHEKPIVKVLDSSESGPLVSRAGENGAYLLFPKTGEFDEVQRIAHEIFSDPYLALEQARVEIRNSSGSIELATEVEGLLKSYGYQIARVSSTKDVVNKTQIYDFSKGTKSFTIDFLKKRLTAVIVEPDKTFKRTTNADLVLILGSDYGARKTKIKLSS